jgi:uncharacterized protein DUF4337
MADEREEAPVADVEQGSKRFELLCGISIAVIAAVLSISDLGAGKFGDDELLAHNEKSGAYLWYQSKGIKETLVEGQRDTLQALMAANSIADEQKPAVQQLLTKLDTRIARYGREKNEILKGSATVGRANWSQEVDGKLGHVTGAAEWEAKAAALGGAGDMFDYASLFLQLALVLGAISLVTQNPKSRLAFFAFMVILAVAGMGFSVVAFRAALLI